MRSNTQCNDNYPPGTGRSPILQQNPVLLEATIILETRKRNRKLAENLMTLLEIGKGRNIVPLIGTGMERDNFEVLNFWVASRVSELTVLDDSEQLDFLVADLRRTLDAAIERSRML